MISSEELDAFLDAQSDKLGSYDDAWRMAEEEFGITPPPIEELLVGAEEAAAPGAYEQILSDIAAVQYRSGLVRVRREIVRASLARELTSGQIEEAFRYLGVRRSELTVQDLGAEE